MLSFMHEGPTDHTWHCGAPSNGKEGTGYAIGAATGIGGVASILVGANQKKKPTKIA